MRVLTYHEELASPGFGEHQQLLELCASSWAAAGFEVEVLGFDDAKQHPEWNVLVQNDLPTVNPEDYELACWRRWLAYAVEVQEGERVLMVDTDVINCGMRPIDLQMLPNRGRMVSLTDAYTPAVVATRRQLLEWATETLRVGRPVYIDGRPHYSDMSKAMQVPDLFDRIHLIGEWRGLEAAQYKAFHVSHAAADGHNRLAIAQRVANLNLTRLESASQGSTSAAPVGCR